MDRDAPLHRPDMLKHCRPALVSSNADTTDIQEVTAPALSA
jgi:hypothetical protein